MTMNSYFGPDRNCDMACDAAEEAAAGSQAEGQGAPLRRGVYMLSTGEDGAEVAALRAAPGVTVVKLDWLLDCIAAMAVLNIDNYSI